jgi:serine/threonine-protein kinase
MGGIVADEEFVIDSYQLVNCVATGNYTQVWEAMAKGSSNRVALKLMLKEAFGDQEHRAIFKNETKIAKSLDHPNIVRCQEVVINKKHAYMVMDYFPAPNLKAQLGTNLADIQSRMRRMMEEICLAVGYMHDHGWLHRDIKPDNVLLNRSSEMRLIDFSLTMRYARGIAKAIVSGKQKIVQGTRTYIAPETIMKQPLSPQTDIYSLGILFFEVLTGVPPFFGASPGDLLAKHVRTVPPLATDFNSNVTGEMAQMVARMLKKKPKDRHQSIQELLAEVRNIPIFKVDPKELEEQSKKEAKEKQLKSLDEARRLDSRADALRQELRAKDPSAVKPAPKKELPEKPAAKVAANQTVAEKPKPAAAAPQPVAPPPAQQPAYPPMYPPQGMPQYFPHPQYPPQPYPMPQYYPGYPPQYVPGMPQGYPQAPMYPPGYPAAGPMPQSPMAPPTPGYPQQPGAQQYPAAGSPGSAPQPVPAPAPQRPPVAPTGRHPVNNDPLPLMEELPPIKSDTKPKDNVPLMEELPPIKKETKQKTQLPLMEDLPPVV